MGKFKKRHKGMAQTRELRLLTHLECFEILTGNPNDIKWRPATT